MASHKIKIDPAIKFWVLLSNRGNPDHGQDPDAPIYGGPQDKLVGCQSLAHASAWCQRYIELLNLGGGNWTGGKVYAEHGIAPGTGKPVARVAYNGRVFNVEDGTVLCENVDPKAYPDGPLMILEIGEALVESVELSEAFSVLNEIYDFLQKLNLSEPQKSHALALMGKIPAVKERLMSRFA